MPQSLEEQLKRLEEEMLLPHVRSSPKAMEKLLADDFVEFGSSGCVYNKQQTLEALGSEPEFQFTISDFRAISLAPDVALTTFRISHFTPHSEQTAISLRCSIWKKVEGRWQLIFHQGTPIR